MSTALTKSAPGPCVWCVASSQPRISAPGATAGICAGCVQLALNIVNQEKRVGGGGLRDTSSPTDARGRPKESFHCFLCSRSTARPIYGGRSPDTLVYVCRDCIAGAAAVLGCVPQW